MKTHCHPSSPSQCCPAASRRAAPPGRGYGDGQHQPGHRLAALGAGEPVGQVDDHAREETRLRQPEQEPGPGELPAGPHEGDRHRAGAPGHQDPREPLPAHSIAPPATRRGSPAGDSRRRRSPSPSRRPAPNSGASLHAVLGEPDIDPVEVGDDVDDEDQRQEAPGDLASDGPGVHSEVRVPVSARWETWRLVGPGVKGRLPYQRPGPGPGRRGIPGSSRPRRGGRPGPDASRARGVRRTASVPGTSSRLSGIFPGITAGLWLMAVD